MWEFFIQLFSAFSLSLTSLLLAFIVGSAVIRLIIMPITGSSDKAKKSSGKNKSSSGKED